MRIKVLLLIAIGLAVILVANVQAQCDGPTPTGPTPWRVGGAENVAGAPAMCPAVSEAIDLSSG